MKHTILTSFLTLLFCLLTTTAGASNDKCGNCKAGTTCNRFDGSCAAGCQKGWIGVKCDVKIADACEDTMMSLDCGPGNNIEILEAIYSYPNGRQCEKSDVPMTCVSYKKSKVVERCLGQSHCDFMIDTNLFEVKCKRPIVKLATVHYKCIPK